MDRPVVVVVDCCHKSPSFNSDGCKRLLQDILGDHYSSSGPIKTTFSSDVFDIYPLRLETKYYTSDVGLCVLQSPTIGDQKFAETVEAVILYLSDDSGLEKDLFTALVDPWLSFIQHWEETAVKILACTRAPSGSSGRLSMQQWCIKNDFELVELDPDDEAMLEADDCGEVTGVRRILQALKAHSWTNLEMKDERTMDADRAERLRTYLQENDQKSPNSIFSPEIPSDGTVASLSNNLQQVTLTDSSASASSIANKSKLHSDIDQLLKQDGPFSDQELFRMANSDDAGGDPDCGDVSFEELFGKFAEMKETAASLPPDQRKAYAEKMTMAFWRAIGGDENEIAGIGDSSDDDNDGTNVSEKP